MQRQVTQTKTVKVGKFYFKIKPIGPADFLQSDKGLPFTFVTVEKKKTLYEKSMEALGKTEKKELSQEKAEEKISIIKEIVSISVLQCRRPWCRWK